MIGPFYPPVSGVSSANETLRQALSQRYLVDHINMGYPTLKEDLGKFSIKKTVHSLRCYSKIYKMASARVVYMTPGQSFLGVMKYSPFLLLAQLLRKKTLIHVHGDNLHRQYEKLKGWKKKTFSEVLSGFDQGIVLSENLRKNLKPFLPEEKISIVHNFVDDKILKAINSTVVANKDTSKLQILFLSNLMRQKGTLDLLKALLILKENGVEFEAVLAGELEAGTSDQVLSLIDKLEGQVTYSGTIRGQSKLDEFIRANVFVLPTFYQMEGQPMALLEAMATGNIVITTQHAGIPDIFVSGKNGFYVRKQDPTDLANKLMELSKILPECRHIMKTNYLETKEKYTVEAFIRLTEKRITE
jgi:glycosyltransferase involved in cell wall biosynthesis